MHTYLYAMLCSCLWVLYPHFVALILGFCMKLNVLLYTVFVFQFDVVDKLCYWVSLLTGICTVCTLWWDSCFVIWWLERLTVIT